MYQEIIREMLAGQAKTLEKARSGDFSEVCWDAERVPGDGTRDKHYTARLRLACYLLFWQVQDERLTADLFGEELKDRETNSFQGIGMSLEILTFLLSHFNADGRYDKLFERAKNANFDCACGYDKNQPFPENLDDYTLTDCIHIAITTQYPAAARQLVGLWKTGVTEWTQAACQELIYFNSNTGCGSENEEPNRRLLTLAQQAGKPFALASAYHSLFRFYVRARRCPEALETFQAMRQRLDSAAIGRGNLLNSLLEDCTELVCAFPEDARPVWHWVKPYLQTMSDSLYGNLYKKAIRAARLMGDPLSSELSSQYRRWIAETRR